MTGSNNTTSQTNNPSGNGSVLQQVLDIASGKTKPTVEFETSISNNSILMLAGAVLFVGLLLIYASKKA